MKFAELYRPDLVTGDIDGPLVRVVVVRDGLEHEDATIACLRYKASCYRLFEGTSFRFSTPISLTHMVES